MNNLELLEVYQYDKKERLGEKTDGGYVIGVMDTVYDCYISAGVSDEESFSRDFIQKHSAQLNEFNCFAFDGTVSGYPYQYTTNISFVRKNVHCINDNNNTNLFSLIEKYNNIFLKMDIEGGEYPWIQSLSEEQLRRFGQIVIEFHGITNDGWGCLYDEKMRCLAKLANTHYIVHAHGNNSSHVYNNIPDVIELTYINKNLFLTPPEKNTVQLPMYGIDFPNNSSVGDYNLNFYPFVSPRV
jgi:hypothetical protein